ncbi:Mor transcription activator family protein [Latilactobacillus fuchuensis]|uniref:Mor transcription activator family protein n=1 Tax=Latilactobacillus fuchuensis TaxID=164393 RepID=UPI0020C7BE7D|nr:Mor transcription activator family protein [Latilactobacillus fuchuensis]MCP8857547.1 Mor transcription activator family protein [Latilactobacillus fuchuensis]
MPIETEILQESYAELFEIVDEETLCQIYEIYRGRQISFPMRLYDRQQVAQRIKKEYDGQNLVALTKKYDYSQRWIRKILQD